VKLFAKDDMFREIKERYTMNEDASDLSVEKLRMLVKGGRLDEMVEREAIRV
jgi:hypothetical protein